VHEVAERLYREARAVYSTFVKYAGGGLSSLHARIGGHPRVEREATGRSIDEVDSDVLGVCRSEREGSNFPEILPQRGRRGERGIRGSGELYG
jgi:hypothetical protein